MPDKKIDIHVHVVGTGDSGSGCVMSREFASGATYAAMLDSLDILSSEASDLMIEELLLGAVNSSEKVERSVLLAMHGVYKNSRLVGAVEGIGNFPMPPVGYPPLTENQIKGIRTWIKEGADCN